MCVKFTLANPTRNKAFQSQVQPLSRMLQCFGQRPWHAAVPKIQPEPAAPGERNAVAQGNGNTLHNSLQSQSGSWLNWSEIKFR